MQLNSIGKAYELAELERKNKELSELLARERSWHEEEIEQKNRQIEYLEDSLKSAQAEIRRLRECLREKNEGESTLLTFEEAVSIVKEHFGKQIVFGGYEFKDKFVFDVSAETKKVENDYSVGEFSVDRNTGELQCFDTFGELLKNPNELDKRAATYKTVD